MKTGVGGPQPGDDPIKKVTAKLTARLGCQPATLEEAVDLLRKYPDLEQEFNDEMLHRASGFDISIPRDPEPTSPKRFRIVPPKATGASETDI